MSQRILRRSVLATLLLFTGGVSAQADEIFTVRIENVSAKDALKLSNGKTEPVGVAPVLYLIHTNRAPLFTSGEPDRGKGLEALAEDGPTGPLEKSLKGQPGIVHVGSTDTPVGARSPGSIWPGDAFEFKVSAKPGERLTIATMFAQSNDLFYAPREEGIALFDASGKPLAGDVTAQVLLWDAGTEVNEEPGVGPNQAALQAAPNTGPAEHGVVRPIGEVQGRLSLSERRRGAASHHHARRLGRPQIDGGIERKAQRVAARCARAAADDADGRVFSFQLSGEIASVEAALRQGLSEAGYVEHRNVAIGAGGRRRYDHMFKCSARSTQPIRRRRTAPQAPPYRIRANADNRKTSGPSLCERL